MKQIHCFLLFLIVLFAINAHGQFRARVKFGQIANLTYQLDCVAGLPVSCSGGNLGELWKREFLKSEEDRRMLREWARLRGIYSQNVPLGKSGAEQSSYPSCPPTTKSASIFYLYPEPFLQSTYCRY